MSVISETVTVNGNTYNYGLALGGAGSTSYRCVKVPVSGSDTIKVTLRSSGSNSGSTTVTGPQIVVKNGGMTLENADGFAVKLHSGQGNYFENCVAEYNSDDGWDLYAAHGAVKMVNCRADYNGLCNGIRGDGNGFKMGGVDNKTPGTAAHLDPLNHVLIGCTAKGNYANGFDRNNQSGVVTMQNCIADSDKGKNYNWPLTGTLSALGYKVTFGKAIIQDCTSQNGINNIQGATLKGNCIGF